MLHSRPLVVNYGGLGIFDPNEPDQRIVVGTNSGFLHMFGNDDGQEDWAFFPKELAPVLARREANATSPDNVYGVDASPVLFRRDRNLDGTINFASGDRVYVYFGLRRGGRMLYALDISKPDDPEFLWSIDPAVEGFAEIGQTWSDPVVSYIPGYVDEDNRRKPVLVFAAGYDPGKDASGPVAPDSMGRGVFIVDAATGALVWSVTPAANSATNLQAPGLLHSVPAVVTPVDSNGDELTDRLYFGDTGGNLWRVDMPGNSLPTALQDTWSIVKLATMNEGTEDTDRRFFSAVDVVRTTFAGRAYDALLLGTGDRSSPNATDVANQFYMIRDPQIRPYYSAPPSAEDCDLPNSVLEFRCQLPLGPADLFDVTSPIQAGTPEEQSIALAALLESNGWRLDLSASGEKSLSRAITIQGRTFFTTFAPNVEEIGLCDPYPGVARLYGLGLATAGAEFDFDGNTSVDRFWTIGTLIPDSPSVHFGSDGEIRLLLPPGSGSGELPSNPLETGASMPKPYGSYWYREEL
jgi:type IV pilus assembly protein PilY1